MAGRRGGTPYDLVRRCCKRFATLGRIRGVRSGTPRPALAPSRIMEASNDDESSPAARRWPHRRAAVAIGIGLLASSAQVVPTAALVGPTTGVCTGTMTLTFSVSPLTAIPGAKSFSVTGGGTCTGLGSGSVTWSSNAAMSSLETSCEEIVGVGGGSVIFQGTNTTVTMVVVGATAASTWTASDLVGASLDATGVFTWTNTTEIDNCLSGGTATVTLWGAFAVAT